MKANQFAKTEDAVSPVIGVILMVAITVVLAAVVFVLVSNLSDTKDQAPDIGFSTDESADRINVISTDSGLLWNQFLVVVTGDDAIMRLNGDADGDNGNGIIAGQQTEIHVTGTETVGAGNFLDFCQTDTTPAAGTPPEPGTKAVDSSGTGSNNINVRIIHVETNTQVYETDFATLAGCTDSTPT